MSMYSTDDKISNVQYVSTLTDANATLNDGDAATFLFANTKNFAMDTKLLPVDQGSLGAT